jgi:hypothetical protein
MTAAELARSAAERLVSEAGLSPCPLPDGLDRASGSWREQPVRLQAWAWRSQALSWVRLVCLERERGAPREDRPLSIGNLLAVGRPERGLPVLGLDVVHVRPEEVVVASDLVPTSGAPVLSEQAPRWARGHFSSDARVVRVSPAALPEQAEHVGALLDRYLSLLGQDGRAADPEQAGARQAEYLAVHRREDPGMRLLGTMFGEAWAQRFLREVMFPEVLS